MRSENGAAENDEEAQYIREPSHPAALRWLVAEPSQVLPCGVNFTNDNAITGARVPLKGCVRHMNRSLTLLAIALTLVAAAAFAPTAAKKVAAMPVFAQAYGLDCKACHTEVPSLNAYGRYVQRSMYAGLDPSGYKKENPLWLGEQVNYATTQAPEYQVGNVAIHAVGVYNNWTFHVQQWIVQNNQTGDLDTAWVSYNGLLKGNAHLVLGKMPGPGPSFWSQWSDVAPFAAPSIVVGEHAQSFASNRWGAKFSYGDSNFMAEGGYFGSGAGLGGATQWGASADNGVDKGWQYHVAFQRPDKPVSIGFVGNNGSVPLAEGGYDRYAAYGAYAQADPTPHLPGALVYYQVGYDDNPMAAGISAHSTAYTAEVFFPVFGRHESILGVRDEMTNDGMGTINHTGAVDLGFRVYKYLHADVEAGLANGTTPVWGGYLWWTQPFGRF